MARCELCGCENQQAFDTDEEEEQKAYDYDDNESSAQAYPICGLCGCRMTGYKMQPDGSVYPSGNEQGFML